MHHGAVRRLLLPWALVAACAAGEPDASEASGGATTSSAPSRLAPSDVTALEPLTSLAEMTPRDALLPDAVASRIGMLVEHYPAEDTLARLRVVCTRFDPKGQIRVVLQPLVLTDGVLGAQDAAVHVFYDLDAATTRVLAQRLTEAHSPPALARELAARGTLSRVTFLRNIDVKGNGWTFGGFDLAAGAVTPIVVPRTGGSEQNVIVHGSGPFASSLAPAPTGEATLGLLLDPVRLGILLDANPDAARSQIDAAISSARALEDPARFDSSTADCASCHLAESARIYGAAKKDAQAPSRTFTAAETLRACGYVGTRGMMSQRVQNESVVAAEKMGALL